MNSDKAADVRDSINALPFVIHDAEPSANYPGKDALTITRGGVEWTHTGECVDLHKFAFRPARINKAGEIGFGKNPQLRPCYEVIVEPLAIPTRPSPTISIPPSMVHEIAKHGCRIRVTSGFRGEHTPGTIRVRDDLAHDRTSNVDGDQCESCGCTRFKLRDGTPECERCGTRLEDEPTATTPTLEEYTDAT